MTAATCASDASCTTVIGRYDGSRRCRSTISRTCASSMPSTVASRRIVRLMSLVCSRTMEMLYECRFSTSTRPSRSNTSPRGARSASVRWWLFSAISAYFACCTTWSTQKLTASTENMTVMPYCSTVSRSEILRQSSIRAICKLRRLYLRILALWDRRRSTTPGKSSTSWNATTPTTALPTACPATAA